MNSPKSRHTASDAYIAWAQSVSGMLTTIKTEYGSVGDMLEHPAWDEGKTRYAVQLTQALSEHLVRIASEMTTHVSGKTS